MGACVCVCVCVHTYMCMCLCANLCSWCACEGKCVWVCVCVCLCRPKCWKQAGGVCSLMKSWSSNGACDLSGATDTDSLSRTPPAGQTHQIPTALMTPTTDKKPWADCRPLNERGFTLAQTVANLWLRERQWFKKVLVNSLAKHMRRPHAKALPQQTHNGLKEIVQLRVSYKMLVL